MIRGDDAIDGIGEEISGRKRKNSSGRKSSSSGTNAESGSGGDKKTKRRASSGKSNRNTKDAVSAEVASKTSMDGVKSDEPAVGDDDGAKIATGKENEENEAVKDKRASKTKSSITQRKTEEVEKIVATEKMEKIAIDEEDYALPKTIDEIIQSAAKKASKAVLTGLEAAMEKWKDFAEEREEGNDHVVKKLEEEKNRIEKDLYRLSGKLEGLEEHGIEGESVDKLKALIEKKKVEEMNMAALLAERNDQHNNAMAKAWSEFLEISLPGNWDSVPEKLKNKYAIMFRKYSYMT